MSSKHFVSANKIRLVFTQAMSDLYRSEVPKYGDLLSLVQTVNKASIDHHSDVLLSIERHGAIRLGTAKELSNMRRLFEVMGMLPVDYYDLSVANIPVHSTAFRAVENESLKTSPFRVFTSLLRLDLIDDEALRDKAREILNARQIFSPELLESIEVSVQQGGLTADQASVFIREAIKTFRWHKEATVDKQTYDDLSQSHRLIADVVSFKGPHINHLTPKVLDIDHAQSLFSELGFNAKENIEGPPARSCPILLRQTSFLALEENVVFLGDEKGTHTARFGEIEQRGLALTPKGRALYDSLLTEAREPSELSYQEQLSQSFDAFPDHHELLREEELAYYQYSANLGSAPIGKSSSLKELIDLGALQYSPITYEDFLPVSAAGIFQSNLSGDKTNKIQMSPNQASFEDALGVPVIDSFSLYEEMQNQSLASALKSLGCE